MNFLMFIFIFLLGWKKSYFDVWYFIIFIVNPGEAQGEWYTHISKLTDDVCCVLALTPTASMFKC